MATRRVNDSNAKPRRGKPPTTSEAQENHLISLAMDAAEAMLRSDNPPAQVVTHYLKLGSSREKLEQERMAEEVELLKHKREALASQKRVEDLYVQAMEAFKAYSGNPVEVVEEEDDYYYDR